MEFENLSSVKANTRRSTTRGDQVVDLRVHVLDAGVRQHDRCGFGGRRTSARFDQHGHTVHRRKRLRDPPCQDASREVVDNGMQIRAGSVEQTDDGRINVPHLVGAGRAEAHLRLRRVHAEPGPTPAVLPHEAVPRGGRGPHLAEPLGEDRECAGRNVAILE